MKKKLYSIAALILAAIASYYNIDLGDYSSQKGGSKEPSSTSREVTPDTASISNPALWKAYSSRTHKLQVQGKGVIVKVLSDDVEGSQHQRILIRVNPKQTILIAHNIDLADRVLDPKPDTVIEFYGEYVWNNKGGVLHWTHKDPRSHHKNGWLYYQGKRYQ